MIILYATSITSNETINIVKNNITLLSKLKNIKVITLVNSSHKLPCDANININKVGDMRHSRHAILDAASEHKANAYFIFDSDIKFDSNGLEKYINEILMYRKKYDFISLYYRGDPPFPAFFTLASSLNDFYNLQTMNTKHIETPNFDDTDFNMSTYQMPCQSVPNKNLSAVLQGRSYIRDIKSFTNQVDESDSTTGGATIYFNPLLLNKKYNWPSYEGKSLTWYDSYRTLKLKKDFKFAKVPLFITHKRHPGSIDLNWESVIRYAIGFNQYMIWRNSQFNVETLALHIVEIYWFCKGMLKKLAKIPLQAQDKATIEKVQNFLTKDIKNVYKEIIKWKYPL